MTLCERGTDLPRDIQVVVGNLAAANVPSPLPESLVVAQVCYNMRDFVVDAVADDDDNDDEEEAMMMVVMMVVSRGRMRMKCMTDNG